MDQERASCRVLVILITITTIIRATVQAIMATTIIRISSTLAEKAHSSHSTVAVETISRDTLRLATQCLYRAC